MKIQKGKMHNPIIENHKKSCGCTLSIAYQVPFLPMQVFLPCRPCRNLMHSNVKLFNESLNLRKKIIRKAEDYSSKTSDNKESVTIDDDEDLFEIIKTPVQKIDARTRDPAAVRVENSEGSFTLSFDYKVVLCDEITVTSDY
jgi:hypothetical protein